MCERCEKRPAIIMIPKDGRLGKPRFCRECWDSITASGRAEQLKRS